MKDALEIRVKAAHAALVVLVKAQAVDIPWHYGIQVKKLRKDLDALETAIHEDPAKAERLDPDILAATGEEVVIPWDEGEQEWLIFQRHGQIVALLDGLVKRLQNSPIARPDIGTAATELEPLITDLNAEGFVLEPEWHRLEREAGTSQDPLGPPWGFAGVYHVDPGCPGEDAPDGTWPAGINPDPDDLDLGRKD